MSNSEQYISTEVLVIGGGIAGFFAAIKAKEQGLEVILADKNYAGKSGGSYFAEGELLFFGTEHVAKMEKYINDISIKSEYLNNHEWDEICLIDAEKRYDDLVSWGIKFVEWVPFKPSMYQIVAMAFREYLPVLRKKALEIGVKVIDRIMFCDLLKQNEEIVGAMGFHTTTGDLYTFQAKATVIATGSSNLRAGYLRTNYWTGDGPAMAYRTGAEITGQEFSSGVAGVNRNEYQQLKQKNKRNGITGKIVDAPARYPFLTTGSGWARPNLNAEGGVVLDLQWEAHMGRAPLYADIDAFTPEKMSGVQNYLQRVGTRNFEKLGWDVSEGGKVQFPSTRISLNSVPGGSGIWPIDKNCATAIPGLYVAGDNCATMACGATYVGKGFGHNHAAVTGTRAGLGAAGYATKSKKITLDDEQLLKMKKSLYAPLERKGGFSPAWLTQVLQGITVPYFIFGIKHGERLSATLTLVEFLNSHLVPKLIAKDAHEWRMAQETKNMILTTEMMLRASIFRTESRGNHFREDYPRRDDPTWLAWVKIKNEQGHMKLFKEPVPDKWWPDLTKSYNERYPMLLPCE